MSTTTTPALLTPIGAIGGALQVDLDAAEIAAQAYADAAQAAAEVTAAAYADGIVTAEETRAIADAQAKADAAQTAAEAAAAAYTEGWSEKGATKGNTLIEGTFLQGDTAWSDDRHGHPDVVSTPGGLTVLTDTDLGVCGETTDLVIAGRNLTTRYTAPVVPGRVYKGSTVFKVMALGAETPTIFNHIMGLNGDDDLKAGDGQVFSQMNIIPDTVGEIHTMVTYWSLEDIEGTVLIDAEARRVRIGIRADTAQTGCVIRVKNTTFEDVTDAWEANGRMDGIDQAVIDAQTAAEAYADASEAAAIVSSNAYADGIVTASEAAAIAAAEAYADARKVEALAYTDGEITTSEAAMVTAYEAYADAAQTAAEVTSAAYADGQVSAEETRAIADAQAKADAAQAAAEAAAALDATAKADAAEADAKTYTEGWSESGADVTGNNTSDDTSKVGGTAAATIRDNAINAMAAVTAQAADGTFSAAEKAQWQVQWPGMDSNYDAVVAALVAVNGSTTAVDAARDALYTFLNTTHSVFATPPSDSAVTQATFTGLVADFYSEMGAALEAVPDLASAKHLAENPNNSNMFPDAAMESGINNWSVIWDQITGSPYTVDLVSGSVYQPMHTNVIQVGEADAKGDGGILDVSPNHPIDVVEGQVYEMQARIGNSRRPAQLIVIWYDASDVAISNEGTPSATGSYGKNIEVYYHHKKLVTAPTGAKYAILRVRANPHDGSAPTSATIWITHLFWAKAQEGQTGFTPWNGGSMATKIGPDGIQTPSISALSGNMGSLTTGQINMGAFTGWGWPAAGAGGGVHVSGSGILMGSLYDASYLQLSYNGAISSKKFTISGTTGDAWFGGTLAAGVVKAGNITAGAITAADINGVARINGNRLNVVAYGAIWIVNNSSVTITHNLGRYVVVTASSISVAVVQTLNNFTLSLNLVLGGSGATVNYAYI